MNTLVPSRPSSGSPRPYRFPEVTRVPLPGGQVVAAHLPHQDMAYVGVLLEAGFLHEPHGSEGVGLITGDLLREGTRQRSGDEFSLALEMLGASWSVTVTAHVLRIGVQVPVSRLDDAVILVAEAVRQPALCPRAFERVRAERVAKLKTASARPGTRGKEELLKSLYTEESRRSRPEPGTVGSLRALVLANVTDFYETTFATAGTLLLAGNLEDVDLRSLGARLLEEPSSPSTASATNLTRETTGQRVVVVDRPGAVQSAITIGHDAPSRSAAYDGTAIEALATILGGTATARLNHHLRDTKGYAFGARGGFDLSRDSGLFYATASVRSEVTAEAVTEMLAVISRLKEHGVDEEELAATKAYQTGSLPIALRTSAKAGAALAQIAEFGLPDDHFTRRHADYVALNKAAVDEAAAARLHPERAVVVVEGDASRIRPAMEAAGMTPERVVPRAMPGA